MNESEQLVVYRGCTPVVDAEYGVKSENSPIEAIVEALAEAVDVDSMDLPPLYDYVDPDALNTLFTRHGEATADTTLLSFQVGAWNVFVRSDGRIRICDSTQPTEPEPVFESPIA